MDYYLVLENKEEIKTILNYLKSLNLEIKKEVDFDIGESEEEFIAIDSGNNSFKDPILNFLGCNYISLVCYGNKGLLKKKEIIIFENVPFDLKVKQTEKIEELKLIEDNITNLLKKIGEKDFLFEKREEEKKFSLKIRNLLEISALIEFNKKYTVRDGSFFIPELNGLKKTLNKKINKENVFSIAKSSKLIRNKLFLTKMKEKAFYKVEKEVLSKFYEEENLLDFDVFVYSYNKSYYQVECLGTNIEEISKTLKNQIKKGKDGYPKNLILADKLAKASESKIKNIERKILASLYKDEEIRSIIEQLKEKMFQIREIF